ncbi:HPF/RaiA family ribosome-associated protein [Variovorax sp. PCZ-1]|uniref:HPF/RaiA family ribosome-associated protein n=1 Tax=Variovorax sp. PCZ-1 TaxID=2835533 RepID=UPI001BCDD771|nr:HPF/RaiA family ribosome-associated protein [Variovorax sp. PCZ-1]MBS7808724.1 HPF/RaiA family ribosome-associated protein [Variovorax sp. PCZ-1]
MRIIFQSNDPEGMHLRDTAQQRLKFVMRRLLWLVPQATVKLDDVNGPQGGVDKQCRVELKTKATGKLVITAMAADWRTALEQAVQRAQQTLLRAWQRKRAISEGRSRRAPVQAI